MPREVLKSKMQRCAIYTRKSSEDGLEQDFNSLDAQREACEAFILSQKHEGWMLRPDHYDDGGISGGTMERPALTRLLADIEAGQVDVVVVYKVDRLTRSLADFARMVDVFDEHEVSFVSVTQQFNTTSSMGRLTLNVLLSFAQFEREVTGERIRDKIAASKKKGMWMGGHVPLGYDAQDRSLVINEPEAETVRTIFRLYLEIKNVRLVQGELKRRGLKTKRTITAKGRETGGCDFSRGHIYKLLSNPVYIGEIVHKERRHPGLHAPIIDAETWDQVQKTLRSNQQGQRRRRNAKAPSLLAGKLFDETGRKFKVSHAVSNGKRYRYYVTSGKGLTPIRIPAHEIEDAVKDALASFLHDSVALIEKLELEHAQPGQLKALLEAAIGLQIEVHAETDAAIGKIFERIIDRVIVSRKSIQIEMDRKRLVACLSNSDNREGLKHLAPGSDPITLERPIEFTRRGAETILLIDAEGNSQQSNRDPALIKAVALGHVWFEDLVSGRYASDREL